MAFFSSSRLRRSNNSSSTLSTTGYRQSESETSSIISFRDGAVLPRPNGTSHLEANNLDEQLAFRLRALETSLRNPNLSQATRQFLEIAISSFEKSAVENPDTLPPYSEDCRPPYKE